MPLCHIPPLEGVSLSPTFDGRPVQRADPLFFEFGSGNAVREANWKLVRSRGQPLELYDLESDRTETRNLAEEQPDRVNAMAKGWDDWFKRCTGQQYPTKGKRRKAGK
jgi:arylsulfatase